MNWQKQEKVEPFPRKKTIPPQSAYLHHYNTRFNNIKNPNIDFNFFLCNNQINKHYAFMWLLVKIIYLENIVPSYYIKNTMLYVLSFYYSLQIGKYILLHHPVRHGVMFHDHSLWWRRWRTFYFHFCFFCKHYVNYLSFYSNIQIFKWHLHLLIILIYQVNMELNEYLLVSFIITVFVNNSTSYLM